MIAGSPGPRAAGRSGRAAGQTVLQHGRAKALRPLPRARREAALRRGLAAYARGDFFLAHELLEPAWMGTADPGERDLHQGLIKLAAAHVHAVRGNPLGVRKNLLGARARLADAAAAGAGLAWGIDVGLLLSLVERALDGLTGAATGAASGAATEAGTVTRLAGAPLPIAGWTARR